MSGPQCCENPPVLSSSCGAGTVEEVGGLETYVVGSHTCKRAIILVSDVYGYEAPKLRKLADKAAADGFYVLVPDFLHGDPNDDTGVPLSVWLQSHGPDKAAVDAKSVIEALKNKRISAIGAAGFCWGAKVVVQLAKSDDIKAAVLLHPSFIAVEDIKEVKTPISILGAEIDKYSPLALLKQFEEVLSAKPEVDHQVKIFPGTTHGWTVRYKDEDELAVKCAKEAHQNLLEWFTKHVQ